MVPGGDGQGRAGKEGQVRVKHPDWGDSCRQGTCSLTPAGQPRPRPVVTPRGQQLLVPQDRAECAEYGGRRRRQPGGPAGTSSRTSTAAHSSSPSQDPEQAGVIDGSPDHLPAAVALHRYRERDVVSDRCAAEHAAMGTPSRPANVLVRPVLGLVGFGPGTPHP